MKARKVVTGQSAEGRSVVVSDGELQPITAALLSTQELNLVWAGDAPFQLPSDASTVGAEGFYPPPGGMRFWYFTLPPDTLTTSEGLDDGAEVHLRTGDCVFEDILDEYSKSDLLLHATQAHRGRHRAGHGCLRTRHPARRGLKRPGTRTRPQTKALRARQAELQQLPDPGDDTELRSE